MKSHDYLSIVAIINFSEPLSGGRTPEQDRDKDKALREGSHLLRQMFHFDTTSCKHERVGCKSSQLFLQKNYWHLWYF